MRRRPPPHSHGGCMGDFRGNNRRFNLEIQSPNCVMATTHFGDRGRYNCQIVGDFEIQSRPSTTFEKRSLFARGRSARSNAESAGCGGRWHFGAAGQARVGGEGGRRHATRQQTAARTCRSRRRRRRRGRRRPFCSSARTRRSQCVRVHRERRVRAVARTLSRKSPNANSCIHAAGRVGLDNSEDAAPLEEAPAPLAHRSSARRWRRCMCRSCGTCTCTSTRSTHATGQGSPQNMTNVKAAPQMVAAPTVRVAANASTRRAVATRRRTAARVA